MAKFTSWAKKILCAICPWTIFQWPSASKRHVANQQQTNSSKTDGPVWWKITGNVCRWFGGYQPRKGRPSYGSELQSQDRISERIRLRGPEDELHRPHRPSSKLTKGSNQKESRNSIKELRLRKRFDWFTLKLIAEFLIISLLRIQLDWESVGIIMHLLTNLWRFILAVWSSVVSITVVKCISAWFLGAVTEVIAAASTGTSTTAFTCEIVTFRCARVKITTTILDRIDPNLSRLIMWANEIIWATSGLIVTAIREEIGVANSSIDTKKTIVFITTICMHDVDESTVGSINTDFVRAPFKHWTGRVQTMNPEILNQ